MRGAEGGRTPARGHRPPPTPPSLPPPFQAAAVPFNKTTALKATVDIINKADDANANVTGTLVNKVNVTALLAKLEAAAAKPNATLPLTLPVTKNMTKVMGMGKMVG